MGGGGRGVFAPRQPEFDSPSHSHTSKGMGNDPQGVTQEFSTGLRRRPGAGADVEARRRGAVDRKRSARCGYRFPRRAAGLRWKPRLGRAMTAGRLQGTDLPSTGHSAVFRQATSSVRGVSCRLANVLVQMIAGSIDTSVSRIEARGICLFRHESNELL